MDNQSTMNMFSNPKFLENIRDTNLKVDVHSSGGSTNSDLQGTLPGFGDVYIHEEGQSNILYFALVQDMGYRIKYHSKNDILTIHTPRKQLLFCFSRREL